MTIAMITLKPHTYAGRHLRAGDRFEADSAAHRKLLQALGRAQDAPAAESAAPAALLRLALRPQDTNAVEGEKVPLVREGAAKPKRIYRRRDLRAES